MGGHPHHGTGAVLGQHVVGDPERNQFAVGGVAHPGADGHAPLGLVVCRAFLLALAAHQITEGLHGDGLLCGGEWSHQWMLGCQHHVAGTEDRVGPGGEHRDGLGGVVAIGIDHREGEFRAGAAADPVGLHRAHPFWPALQLGQVVEQLVGVGGDLQEPLAQLALLHEGSRAPGPSLAVHLFIGEHRLIDRVPVHRGVLLVGQAGLQELQEQPLGPAVVIGVAGGQFPIPVDREAQLVELLPHGGDVLVGPGAGIHPPLDGGVLRRQAEGVPPHGVQHLAAP